MLSALTDHLKVDEIAARRLGADLALVQAGVFELGGAQLERPLAGVTLVVHGEAAVLGVDGAADAHDVQVAVPHPRYLQGPLSLSNFSGNIKPLPSCRRRRFAFSSPPDRCSAPRIPLATQFTWAPSKRSAQFSFSAASQKQIAIRCQASWK